MKIRFGIGLGADTGPEQLASIVDHLESTGVDSVWFSELVYSKAVDPFVGMAYALARTTNLKVGTSVAVLPGRHPVLVAKQLASLAGLAPKRVLPVFGLRSAIPAEREIFVVPDGQRAAVFDESLQLLRSVLEQQDVAFSGDYFAVSSAGVEPRPVKPLDIWLGGSAPAAFRRIGQLGDGWLGSFLTPDEARGGREQIQRAAAEAGREIETRSLRDQPRGQRRRNAGRLVAAVKRRRPDLDPDRPHRGRLAAPAPSARRLCNGRVDAIRDPAREPGEHRRLHRSVRGGTCTAAELTSSYSSAIRSRNQSLPASERPGRKA